ncbi:hypothetical protein [Streptomyces pseudovenezuelae]|uniref:Integrase n=1 Tax=Streptomyces pseudovenezuelae TaxID=67350 RepID=A0ABT6LZW5_9ACTN|nr:hypothetical protein [Streptomyces pseudovenezuelae]MDH6221847.1 hypothetical protein [Streptomyces pseudovenezuelae]
MLHTLLWRRANGETVEYIQPALLIPTGRRKGHSPSLSSIYRALAEHEKTQAYPEAIETAHADFAALQQHGRSPRQSLSVTRHLAAVMREQGLGRGVDDGSGGQHELQ